MPINFDCLWQKLDSYGNVLPFEVWMQKFVQGDVKENLLIQMVVPLKICISDSMLVEP